MKKFNYDLKSVSNCIVNTEKQLRDLISTILISKDGPNWENKSSVFTKKIEELKEKMRLEESKYPNQQVSSRLIDYSEISDLKDLIINNWNQFESILFTQRKTISYFDELIKFRISVFHGRDLLEHQKYLALGICGEFLLCIDNWENALHLQPQKYEIGFRFSVPSTLGDGEEAEREAKSKVEKWLGQVLSIQGAQFGVKTEDDKEISGLMRLPSGTLRISYAWRHKGYDGSYFRYSSVTLNTDSLKALEEIIKAGSHPYWEIKYIFNTNLPVDIIKDKVLNQTGNVPDSSGGQRVNQGPFELLGIEYRPLNKLSINIQRGHSNDGTISIAYDIGYENGFWNAHKFLTPRKILSFLYGEITQVDFKRLLDESTKHI